MDPSNSSPAQRRLLCAEPLERRWLLSAATQEPDDDDNDADDGEVDHAEELDDADEGLHTSAPEQADAEQSDAIGATLVEDTTPVPPAVVAPTGGEGVELIEFELAAADEPEEEIDIDVSALPRAVL